MKKKIVCALVTMALIFSIIAQAPLNGSLRVAAQNSYTAYSANDLISDISVAPPGDTINIGADITVTAQLTIGKSITINGNGHAVSVTNPGLSDSGLLSSNPSAYRAFFISGGTVTLNNMTIKGGQPFDSYFNSHPGSGIYNAAGATLHLNFVTISNSGGATNINVNPDGYGGGIGNSGTVYLNNCSISRNGDAYGGGFYNDAGATMFIENSTFSEDRSLSGNGGGGAGENHGYLYVNNSTFANNISTELGGAINNISGSAYIINSTFTGNVTTQAKDSGGAMRINVGDQVTLVNDIFAYNYGYDSATSTYRLSDYSTNASYSPPTAAYNCIFQAVDPSGIAGSGNTQYHGTADGSNDSLFSGGATSKVLATDGSEIGTATVYQPFLSKSGNSSIPTVLLQSGSSALNAGIQTAFTNGNGTPTVGYNNGSWHTLTGDSSNLSGCIVTADQNGSTRASTPAVGAVENTASGLSMLKVNLAANGTVIGGTIYGDTYANGTNETLLAIPSNGYKFSEWDYVLFVKVTLTRSL